MWCRVFVLLIAACIVVPSSSNAAPASDDLNPMAERYVKLVLAMGQHDTDYVDAYYGPPEWKTEAEKAKKSLDAIENEAGNLLQQLERIKPAGDEILRLRHQHLVKQLRSLV